MLLLLFYQASMPPSKVLSASLTADPLVEADLTVDDSEFLSANLSSSGILSSVLTVTQPPETEPIPERHYIWVYDLSGNKVDVLA